MNQGQFKDPVCYMCLAGTAVAYWSLTQEIVGSSPFTVMTIFLSLNSANSRKHLGKTQLCRLVLLIRALWIRKECVTPDCLFLIKSLNLQNYERRHDYHPLLWESHPSLLATGCWVTYQDSSSP